MPMAMGNDTNQVGYESRRDGFGKKKKRSMRHGKNRGDGNTGLAGARIRHQRTQLFALHRHRSIRKLSLQLALQLLFRRKLLRRGLLFLRAGLCLSLSRATRLLCRWIGRCEQGVGRMSGPSDHEKPSMIVYIVAGLLVGIVGLGGEAVVLVG